MTPIIQMLLYLALISPNTPYTPDQLNQLYAQNQPRIQTVMCDPNQMNAVNTQYVTSQSQYSTNQNGQIVVVDDHEDP